MVVDLCELCGNHSSRFTCQMCITTGNFWIGKAKFSFSGKKQIVTNLTAEKLDLQKQVCNAYAASFESKDSFLRSLQHEHDVLKERIVLVKQQTSTIRNQILVSERRIHEFRKSAQKTQSECLNLSNKIAEKSGFLIKKEEVSLSLRNSLQQRSCNVLRCMKTQIFRIQSDSNDKIQSVMGIPFSECESASLYVKQIKINSGEDISQNTSTVLSLLVHLCNVISAVLNCNIPHQMKLFSFSPSNSSPILFYQVKQLSTNILYICLSQQVHPELLDPYALLRNLHHLFEGESVCDFRPFFHSLDRPGDIEEDEIPPTSSESDTGWEDVTEDVVLEQQLPVERRTSYIGSLIWKS